MTLHFDHSVIKINKDGSQSISAHLDKGEKLADGRTYADVLASRPKGDDITLEDIPATEHDHGLTSDATNTNTAPVGSPAATGELEGTDDGQIVNEAVIEASEHEEGSENEQETALTENETGDSSTVVPVDGEGEENSGAEKAADEEEEIERPKDSDNKDAWFTYAKSKGYEGDRDDLTNKQYIEQFGA
jgi:hypothetical protein